MEFIVDAVIGIFVLFVYILAFIFITYYLPYKFMMAFIKNPLINLLEKRFNLENADDNNLTKDLVGGGLGCFAFLMFVLGMYLSANYLLPILLDIGR